MKKNRYILSLILVISILTSNISMGLGTVATSAASLTPFSASAFRRPTPNVTLDVTDVTRVGAASDASMGSGTNIKKATPSGVPYITGTYASQAYDGETPQWPAIVFTSSVAVTITSVAITGGSASVTLTAGSVTNTTAATWEIRGGTATAGSTLKIAITYTYTWSNPYTGVLVTDTYTTNGYSYVENIIFPSGVWVFASAYSNVANAADVQYVSRLLGRGVYGQTIGRAANAASTDYSAGYNDFSSNSHVDDGDTTIPKKTMLIANPAHLGAYDQYIANGTGSYASGDSDRGKTIVYLDTSVQTLQSNNFRMHFFINGTDRSTNSARDVTWETINVRDGDVPYTGGTDNVLGTSSTAAKAALNPTGPVDGTTNTGGLYLTAGMQAESTLYGTGAAGLYTLVTQWTARGNNDGTTTPNWMQYYHAITIEIIHVNKSTLRSTLNTAIGTTTKSVTGASGVTTILTANGADPTNGGISNTYKGKNPQNWYYTSGWSNYATAYDDAWKNMQKPNANQSNINNSEIGLTSGYNDLILRGANYSNSSDQNLVTGLGNTFFGSSIAPLNTIITAVASGDSSYNSNLNLWKDGSYDSYTNESKAALEQAYAEATAAQEANYTVMYQPYVDYCAQQLQTAIDGLEYVNTSIGNVSFDGNGSTGGSMPTQSITIDSSANLRANSFIKAGYSFQGWSTSSNGDIEYTDGASFTMGTSNVTLYAKWTANTYTVTFDAQGGSVSPATSTVTYNSTYGAGTGGFPTPARTGYTFGGWYTSTGGTGTNISSSTTVTITEAQTLYAKWAVNQISIIFDANGGTGGTLTLMQYGAALTAPTVTKIGCTFTGWSPSLPAMVPAANTTYTAQWSINTYIITFDANGGTGGTSVSIPYSAALTPPTVTKTGYTFSGWSPAVPATVPASDATYTAQWNVILEAPTSVSSPSKTDTTVTLSWDTVTNAAGYNVYCGGLKLNTLPVTSTTYTATGLTQDTDYSFTVTAVNGAVESAASTALVIKTTADVQFVVSNTTGAAGDIINVSVVVSEYSSMAAATFELPFDPNLLEYVSAAKGAALADGLVSINYDAVNHKIIVTYISTEPLAASGSILDVQFRIKISTAPQTIVSDFSVVDLINTDYEDLPYTITQGTIGVESGMLGDVNNDGIINVVDALMTLHHVSEYRLLSDSQKQYADVDGNGIINIIDALKILQFSSGTITSFY